MDKEYVKSLISVPAIDVDVTCMPPRRPMGRGVKPHASYEAIRTHPRRHCVVFSPEEKCFRVNMRHTGNGVRYTGITNALKQHFWPDFDLEEARKGARKNKAYERDRRSKRRAQESVSWASRKRAIERGTRKYGVELGKIVHKQVEDYTNLSRVRFREKYRESGVNSYAVKVAMLLHAMKLKPMMAEVPIFCDRSHTATSIDLICTDVDSGNTVLVELKTSYQGYFAKNTGRYMHSPMSNWPSHPLNHARIQVMMSRLILKHRYNIRNCDVLVVHAYREGVQAHCIPRQWFATEDTIYHALVNKRVAKRNKPTKRRQSVPVKRRRSSGMFQKYQYSRKRKTEYIIL